MSSNKRARVNQATVANAYHKAPTPAAIAYLAIVYQADMNQGIHIDKIRQQIAPVLWAEAQEELKIAGYIDVAIDPQTGAKLHTREVVTANGERALERYIDNAIAVAKSKLEQAKAATQSGKQDSRKHASEVYQSLQKKTDRILEILEPLAKAIKDDEQAEKLETQP